MEFWAGSLFHKIPESRMKAQLAPSTQQMTEMTWVMQSFTCRPVKQSNSMTDSFSPTKTVETLFQFLFDFQPDAIHICRRRACKIRWREKTFFRWILLFCRLSSEIFILFSKFWKFWDFVPKMRFEKILPLDAQFTVSALLSNTYLYSLPRQDNGGKKGRVTAGTNAVVSSVYKIWELIGQIKII